MLEECCVKEVEVKKVVVVLCVSFVGVSGEVIMVEKVDDSCFVKVIVIVYDIMLKGVKLYKVSCGDMLFFIVCKYLVDVVDLCCWNYFISDSVKFG